MDPYSSSSRENFNIKTRKPYTITKQRERWTEDEHNSFLEALKLYGRAWQRIEEHIGTKTAVQIRSHAQKFFTKLEKEAVARGVPIRQALDMEIPPPRPKRKPNYPYPRKIGHQNHPDKDGIQATLVSSVQSGIQILDLEKKPLPETTNNEQKPEENAKLDEQVENACELLPSDNENPIPRQAEAVNLGGAFREFIPEAITHDEANESYITIETREHQKLNQDGTKHIINTTTCNTSSLFENSHETIIHCQYSDKLKQQPGNVGALSINDIQGVPRHVPVQVVDGNQGINAKNPDTSFQESTLNKSGGEVEHPNSSFVNIAASAVTGNHNSATRSSCYQTVPPTFHPLSSPLCDNNHRSFLHVSSTISSLIVSSLLQNPAAHAAASFAATYWHPTTTEASSADSPESTPSMAAIAAATVAAATAWWAAHGLLPVCTPPFYPGYSSTSPFSYGTPPIGGGNQARVANNGGGEKEGTVQEEKMNEGFPKEHPHPGSVDLLPESSEDSDGQGDDKKSNAEPIAEEMAPATTELHDSDKTNNVRKQVDRSSCGSNTTSSSEIETDALPKHGKEREEAKGSDVNLDSISRTRSSGRSTISPNESWKEVSEEGRLAFQALFSRQVLPQSFCNAVTSEENGNQNGEGGVSHLDLNREAGGEKDMVDEGLLRMGLGSVKLNIHHTGFKPYKRCSIEAKEGKIVSQQNDEKGPKRMRLEADQLQLD